MKTIMRFLYMFVGVVILAACAPHARHPKHPKPPKHPKAKVYKATKAGKHHHPPGQVKKITGSKSAKPYAPGQQKKHKPKHKPHKKH